MADNDFNFKSFKPTLKPPSDMGKKIDSGFKSKLRNVGVNMNAIKEEENHVSGDGKSLKKKIFSLPKMETLVMTDEYLSNIYNKLKTDAQETYGYHWNETIMNILFNEYVLDDAGYLQKYKNTKTYNKKRRGQEGVEELEKELQDKVDDVKADGEEPVLKRDKKVSDVDSNKDNLDKFKKSVESGEGEEVNEIAENMKDLTSTLDKEEAEMNELFGFGQPTAPLTTHKASKNDTYFVRKKDNTAVGVISANLPAQQNQQTAEKFADPNQFARTPWYVAVSNKVKGVPTEVTDGSLQDFQQDVAKYSGVPAMAENFDNVAPTDGISAGQFAAPLDSAKHGGEIADHTYNIDETTTSASSGQFSGPAIWAKTEKNSRWAHTPAWHGGKILKESKEYLTNPDAFKQYVRLYEAYEKIEKLLNEGSLKQDALRMLKSLEQMKVEYPELVNDPHFQEVLNYQTQQANAPDPVTMQNRPLKPRTDSTNQWQGQVSEQPNLDAALEKDLKNTGKPVDGKESDKELKSKDGLFKGKWNENKTINEDAVPPVQQQGDAGENIFVKIAKLVFPETNKPENELATLGQNFARDFFASTTPEKAYEMLNSKLKSMNLAENNMKFNEEAYKQFFKEKLKASGKSLKMMSPEDKKAFFGMVDNEFKSNGEAGVSEGGKWTAYSHTPDEQLTSFEYFAQTFENGNFSQLKKMLGEIKQAGQLKDLRMFLDEMGLDEVKNWAFDNLSESMVEDQPDSMARTMDSEELNTTGKPMGGSAPVSEAGYDVDDVKAKAGKDFSKPEWEKDVADLDKTYAERNFAPKDEPEEAPAEVAPKKAVSFDNDDDEGGAQDSRINKQADADATKFREFLQSKFGVDSVAELSPRQKQEVMKGMAFNKSPEAAPENPSMDLKNFAKTDAERAEYQNRDNKQLGFLAQKNANVGNIQDYSSLEKEYAATNNEKMFHPMAILASIEAMPQDQRMKYSNIENVLRSQVKKQRQAPMNEERKTPSMLNLDRIKKETATLTQKDMASADALKQAKVYPNPDEFYIEQDDNKVQDFKTGEELEKEALAKMEEKKALQNVGNSTNDNGKEITKRNLSKEEKLRLAMDRGDGMHNIVYDNKPSEKFEKRLKNDMGEDQYKLRQEKMNYREDMPSYNKDTQPVQTGDKKEQDDKFKKGYNEAFTGKYTDGFGKSKLVEFQLEKCEEVESINEGDKLTLEGLGNKYTQKINESEVFADVIKKYDFYLVENKVVMVKVKTTAPEVIAESAVNKMKHLMGYNSNEFVNTKKSVKF